MKFPKLFPARGSQQAIVKARESRHLERKSIGIQYPPELFWQDATFKPMTGATPISKRRAFDAVALVFACMDYRATKLSEAPVWIAEEDEDGESFIDGEHPLSELLERPNPDMSMAELLELLSLYDDATGGWLLVKNQNNIGRVGSMYPYAYDEFSVEPAFGRIFGRFRVQTLEGYREFGPDQVIFKKRPSLAALNAATSRVSAALSHINIGDQMRQTIQQLLRRAIRPSSKTEVPGNYTTDQWDRLSADFQAAYQGYLNAGKNILVEGGAKFELLHQGMKDLELGPVQGDVEAAICSCFQLHPALVGARIGLENSSGFADLLASATEASYDNAFIPSWSRMEEKLTLGLLRAVDPNPRRFIRFDKTKVKALQEDLGAKTLEAKNAAGFWLIDEQRAHTGKEPLKNGEGQVLSKPGAIANPNADPNADPNTDPAAKSAFAARSLRVVTGAAIAGLSLSAAWQEFDAKATAQESRYEQAALAQFDRERDRVVAIVEASVPAQKAETEAERIQRIATAALLAPYLEAAILRVAAQYSENGIFRQEWVAQFTPLVRQTVIAGARDVAAAIGIDFTASNPRVQQLIRQRVTKLAGAVTETSLTRVRDVITAARDEGVGMNEITRRIREDAFGGTITKTRATTIARTETVGALNEGEHLAALESGVMQSKRWLSQRDGKVRPDHKADDAAGWIPIADTYPNSGLDYPHQPGAPAEQVINCRCSQLFSDLTADEANRGTA